MGSGRACEPRRRHPAGVPGGAVGASEAARLEVRLKLGALLQAAHAGLGQLALLAAPVLLLRLRLPCRAGPGGSLASKPKRLPQPGTQPAPLRLAPLRAATDSRASVAGRAQRHRRGGAARLSCAGPQLTNAQTVHRATGAAPRPLAAGADRSSLRRARPSRCNSRGRGCATAPLRGMQIPGVLQ